MRHYSIVMIGAGNLACSLSHVLKVAGHKLLQVYSRHLVNAQQLATTVGATATDSWQEIEPDADVYIYSLVDEAYKYVPELAVKHDAVHLLTSGSVDYQALTYVQHRGVLYPFQTFSKLRPITDFSSVPVLIEGEDKLAKDVAQNIADSISKRVYYCTAENRARLHLAGVLANNFTNCMYALAEEQLKKADLPFDILLPLIDETANKVHQLAPRKAQTGPAIRGDKDILKKQEGLLETEEDKLLYRLISENIITHKEMTPAM